MTDTDDKMMTRRIKGLPAEVRAAVTQITRGTDPANAARINKIISTGTFAQIKRKPPPEK